MKHTVKAFFAMLLVGAMLCAFMCACGGGENGGAQSEVAAAQDGESETENVSAVSGESREESAEPDASAEESFETEESSEEEVVFTDAEYFEDISGGRALVSNGAACEINVKHTGNAEFLTDGQTNDIQLNTEGVLFCAAGGKEFEITLDLGTVRADLAIFDLWAVRSSATADIAEMQVFAAGEDKIFEPVCEKITYSERPATAMGRLYLLRAEAKTQISARYVRYAVKPRGTANAAFAEAAVYAEADVLPADTGEKTVYEYDRAPEEIKVPHVTWSFITTMTLNGATKEMSERYFDTLEEAGIEGLIILHGAGADGGVYENSALNLIFARAKERGMKVFMGMNPGNDIYNNIGSFLAANKKALAALYQRYYVPYPEVFCGWYMTQEFSNGDFHKYPDETARILNGVLENIKELNGDLPLMLSPYCTSWGGTDKQLKEDLEKIITQVAFREYDVYCPQDGVGCGYFAAENAGDYLSAAAVVCKRHGIKFWVNLENFILDSSVPDGEDDIPAPVTRFIKQIRTAAKYADTLATFTYEAYMPEYFSNYTIYNDIEDYHKNYIYYLNTGKPPAENVPAGAEARVTEDYITVYLPTPTYRVQAVRFVRNGKETWFGYRLLRTSGGVTYLTLPNDAPSEPFKVTFYDHSANSTGGLRFEANGERAVSGGPVDRTKEGVNVALGKSYISSAPTHDNGDSGNELTDGKHGRASFTDPAWQGYNSPVYTVTVDLGEVTDNIGDIRVEVLGGGYGAVMEPRSITVEYSRDGVSFDPAGEIKCADAGGNSAYIKAEELLLDESISARYVRLTVSVIGWFFVDEIEIITYN